MAKFAVAYGFPPSACANQGEAIALLDNVNYALALQSLVVTRGIAASLKADGLASLLRSLEVHPAEIAKVEIAAMKADIRQGNH